MCILSNMYKFYMMIGGGLVRGCEMMVSSQDLSESIYVHT